MITLACNAAEGRLNSILGRAETIIAARQWDTPTRATETLTPGLDALLRECGLSPSDIGRMACVHGPGSFTGIRLLLATAAAFRRVLGIPLAGLDYLQALAVCAQRAYPQAARLGVITHARRDSVHYQVFENTTRCAPHALPLALAPALLLAPHDAAQRLVQDGTQALIGTGLERHTVFAALPMPRCTDSLPAAEDIWRLALHADYIHADIVPLYVRPCDAVENLSAIASKQGMNPTAAHERLAALLSAPIS